MKRVVLLLSFLAINVFAIAQDVKIKGVPVVNKHETFVREIQKKGFTKSNESEKSTFLKGEFLGENVYMIAGKLDEELSHVTIAFEENDNDNWKELKDKCDNLAKLYTEKYGKPIEKKDFHKHYTDGSGMEKLGLMQGLITYSYSYVTDSAIIVILIDKELYITITYLRKDITEKVMKSNIDDI